MYLQSKEKHLVSKEASPQIYSPSAVMRISSQRPGWLALKIKITVVSQRGFSGVSDDPAIYLETGKKRVENTRKNSGGRKMALKAQKPSVQFWSSRHLGEMSVDRKGS